MIYGFPDGVKWENTTNDEKFFDISLTDMEKDGTITTAFGM